VGLSDYKKWTKYFAARDVDIQNQVPIVQRAYARVGLIGNPSDGFHGKTIALSIKNFWAEATIFESPRLNLIPHPLNDPTSFGNLADLHVISKKEGYMGGLRLVQATCKKFYEFCDVNGIALPRRNFELIQCQNSIKKREAVLDSALNFGFRMKDFPVRWLPVHWFDRFFDLNFFIRIKEIEMDLQNFFQKKVDEKTVELRTENDELRQKILEIEKEKADFEEDVVAFKG